MRPPKLPATLHMAQLHTFTPNIRPNKLFKCGPMGELRAEVRRGPSGFGLDRIEMHRGSRGLCIRFEGRAVARLHSRVAAQRSIGIGFHPAGHPHAYARAFRLSLSSLPDGTGTYWIRFQPPGRLVEAAQSGFSARLGDLGMSPRQASIHVTDPLLPDWVNDPDTTWEVH
jgi:hypothetical protein